MPLNEFSGCPESSRPKLGFTIGKGSPVESDTGRPAAEKQVAGDCEERTLRAPLYRSGQWRSASSRLFTHSEPVLGRMPDRTCTACTIRSLLFRSRLPCANQTGRPPPEGESSAVIHSRPPTLPPFRQSPQNTNKQSTLPTDTFLLFIISPLDHLRFPVETGSASSDVNIATSELLSLIRIRLMTVALTELFRFAGFHGDLILFDILIISVKKPAGRSISWLATINL